jgi:outer membrane protein TolC
MIKDVEDLYWELYLAYRNYDALVANRNSMHRSWQEVKAKMDAGAVGGSAADEAQARENYFDARSQVENALSVVYTTENAFRKQMGMPVNDGKIIRPKDDPVEAEFVVQWEPSVVEALTRRPELRRQKWQVKSLELQYKAAKNAANPTLNAVGSYQVNGFGTNLLEYQNGPGLNSMYGSMANGNLNGWYAGLQFNMPIGLRTARMQVHNIELQMVKAKAALAAQELDITHDLALSIQNIDAAYMVAQTVLDRKVAAVRRVEATKALYDAGARNDQGLGVTLDLVLRAQAANAAAEIAYFTALINYNKAIVEYHWRRGMLLEVDGIHLSESEWDEQAKCDALKRAWARSYALPADCLDTQPEEFGSGVAFPKADLYNGLPQGQPIKSDLPDPAASRTEAGPGAEGVPTKSPDTP